VAQLGRSVAHMVERENVLRYMLVPRPACLLISSAETHHASITNQGRDRGADTMIVERGARPDALPGEARRRRRDVILVVAVIIVFIVILASAYWH